MTEPRDSTEYQELISRYNKWREAYLCGGKPAPNEPAWENGRLNFRIGYPYPDWRAFIIDETDDGYRVLNATTERSNVATEGWKATFSRLEDAGKYVIATIADYLRIECRTDPIALRWRTEGLDPRVSKEELPGGLAKYVLTSNPDAYMISTGRGTKPEHHVLPLSYDALNLILAEGLTHEISHCIEADH